MPLRSAMRRCVLTWLALLAALAPCARANPVDAPADAADGPAAARLDHLLADDWCGDPTAGDRPDGGGTAPHFKVVFAYPADVGDRLHVYASALQRYVKGSAALLAHASDKTIRLDRGTTCGDRYLDILSAELPRTAAEYRASTGLLFADVRGRLPVRPRRNFIVFADLDMTGSYRAFGDWPHDSSPHATNQANVGDVDRSAWLIGGNGRPQFFAGFQSPSLYTKNVLHEVLHTLGAVQPGAPHFSGGTHCYQIWDVMCYTPRDGTSEYLRTCTTADGLGRPEPWPVDCSGDDYFSPSPAPGSWLASHWNLHDSGFLCALARCGVEAYAPRARIEVVANDGRQVTLDLSPSSDRDGTVRRRFFQPPGGSRLQPVERTRHVVTLPAGGRATVRAAVADDDGILDTATLTVDAHTPPGTISSPRDPPPGLRTTCDGTVATITARPGITTVGTPGDDVIAGTAGPDDVDAGAGNDRVCGGGGADTLRGGAGTDVLRGESDEDVLSGAGGDDLLSGGSGRDSAAGGPGGDTLRGGPDGDRLDGGADADGISGGDGDDELLGGDGDDRLRGGNGDDLLAGGPGSDDCAGDLGVDALSECAP